MSMARAATTSDAFNAVAEPRRREILNFIALQERPVGEIVDSLGMEQPSVSKHLRVLLEVGPSQCAARRAGACFTAPTRRPFVRFMSGRKHSSDFWRHQLSRVKERAERKK